MTNRAAADVRFKEAAIQHVDLDQSRKSKLPRFQNQVAIMEIVYQVRLGPIQLELNLATRLVHHLV